MNSQDKYISDFSKKYLETIKKIYDPEELWFFGSRISGKAREDSDIDLILVSNKFKGEKFILRMGNFLKNINFNKHIDALCYTPEEFKQKKQEIGIIKEAVNKGFKAI